LAGELNASRRQLRQLCSQAFERGERGSMRRAARFELDRDPRARA